jgi:hypothetical protein
MSKCIFVIVAVVSRVRGVLVVRESASLATGFGSREAAAEVGPPCEHGA